MPLLNQLLESKIPNLHYSVTEKKVVISSVETSEAKVGDIHVPA